MRVISLWQPWASLVVMGAKKMETRHWDTKYRGPLLIHAAKKKLRLNEIHDFDFLGYLEEFIPKEEYSNLPYGAIVGKVDLVDTVEFKWSPSPREQLSEYKANENPWIPFRSEGNDFDNIVEATEWEENIDKEMAFGDFCAGRFGWLLQNPVKFEYPIIEKGSQGFWNFEKMSLIKLNMAVAERNKIDTK